MIRKGNIRTALLAIIMVSSLLSISAQAADSPKAGFGKAVEFNAGSIVELSHDSSYDLTTNFTIELWFKPSSVEQTYLVSRNGMAPNYQWGIVSRPSSKEVFLYTGNLTRTGFDGHHTVESC